MATKKKGASRESTTPAAAPRSETYDQALIDYAAAIELTHKGDFEAALGTFNAIESANPDEPELVERVRAFAMVCDRKLAAAPEAPSTADGFYLLGVVRANDGLLDEALDLLNRGLEMESGSPRVLYARASVYALKGQADTAVADLRNAVAGEPQLRFQASNDPDFARIRDEASFIDVIEPSPTGV